MEGVAKTEKSIAKVLRFNEVNNKLFDDIWGTCYAGQAGSLL